MPYLRALVNGHPITRSFAHVYIPRPIDFYQLSDVSRLSCVLDRFCPLRVWPYFQGRATASGDFAIASPMLSNYFSQNWGVVSVDEVLGPV